MQVEEAPPVAIAPARSSKEWILPPAIRARTIGIAIAALALLLWSGHRVEMDRMISLVGEAIGAAFHPGQTTQVGRGMKRVTSDLFPLQLSEVTPVDRIEGLDRKHLPWFSHLEVRSEQEVRLNPDTFVTEKKETSTEVLVEPLGYLGRVLIKTLESLEMGLWGTLLAILISAPLAVFAARNYAPHPVLHWAARSCVALARAVPELISALFLVLAFGFGPIAGVVALAVHAAGFLGKFFAEDIENAPEGPQEALRCLGLSRLRVLWYAVLPEVWPQYIAYILYILDRNVRMATVIGIVGAGGIGQELKGRYEMFNYGHVGTILLVLFATVLLLDLLSSRLRARVL